MNALLNSLTESEFMLVRETAPDQLVDLHEDDLVALHTRVRRARNKYSKLYRREASARVAEQRGRGKARPKNTRNAQKAEVFEDALARVSRALAAAARRSATELKAERLDVARAARNTAPPKPVRRAGPEPASPQRSQRPPASAPAVRKQHASTRAMGARRQVKRDSR
jgi:hypothetical protein